MRNKQSKRIRELDGEIKRLRSLLKRCKCNRNMPEIEDSNDEPLKPIQPCPHCAIGFMVEIEIIGRPYFKCSSCGRTKKA